jgi:nucleotide-binding universal stress UspA family protein
MFKNLLVAINGTAQCDKVMELAASLEHDNMHVHYVCVIATEYWAPNQASKEASPAAEREQARVERIMEDARCYWMHRKINATGMVITGTPERSIPSYAEDNQCDLIIMGHHHLSTFERLVGNSVAYQVLENAPCPVLIEVR